MAPCCCFSLLLGVFFVFSVGSGRYGPSSPSLKVAMCDAAAIGRNGPMSCPQGPGATVRAVASLAGRRLTVSPGGFNEARPFGGLAEQRLERSFPPKKGRRGRAAERRPADSPRRAAQSARVCLGPEDAVAHRGRGRECRGDAGAWRHGPPLREMRSGASTQRRSYCVVSYCVVPHDAVPLSSVPEARPATSPKPNCRARARVSP